MRVYLNSFRENHYWSVDQGSVSSETQWDKVIIKVPSETRQDLTKLGSETEPCCWIECNGKLKELSPFPRIAVIE